MDAALKNALLDLIKQIADVGKDGKWSQIRISLRPKVYEELVKKLLRDDAQTIKLALIRALDDNKITMDEWRKIGLNWVRSHTTDPFAKDVLASLNDGKITKNEAVAIAVKWAQSSTDNADIKNLLGLIKGNGFDVDGAKKLLIKYLQGSGLAGIATAVENALTTGKVTSRDVFLMLASWAAISGEEGLADILEQLKNAPPEEVILGWLANRIGAAINKPAADVTAFFDLVRQEGELVEQQDWLGAISLLMGTVHFEFGKDLLDALRDGKFKEFIIKEMASLLQGFAGNEAQSLAASIVGIITGTQSLFATAPESDAASVLTSAVALERWRSIREVLYLARLAVFSETSVVSTDPQGRPNVFAAAAIRFVTPLHELLPAGTKQEKKEDYADTVTRFLDVQFAGRMRPFNDVSAMETDDLSPDSTVPCSMLYFKVRERRITA